MELLECTFTNQNNNSIATLIFNKTFKKIKVMIITENETSMSKESNVNGLNNDTIEIKYSKEKREINLNVEKKDYYIFVIIEIDNNLFNKTYIVDNKNLKQIFINEKNKQCENKSNIEIDNKNNDIEINNIDQAMIYGKGISKLFKKGFFEDKKECSIKNENIFAYIKRKCD